LLEATETSDGLVDQVLDFLFIPHIGAHKFGLSAEFAQFSGQLLAFLVRRPETMTRAPSRAKARAVARPMPVRAPVISTAMDFTTEPTSPHPYKKLLSARGYVGGSVHIIFLWLCIDD
jgi:hypothetical protein